LLQIKASMYAAMDASIDVSASNHQRNDQAPPVSRAFLLIAALCFRPPS
jgi:hypothetical protein